MAEAMDFSDFHDYYAVLEVLPDANLENIKKSYRKLILDWHPDKRPESPSKTGTKMFQLVNDAWDTLKDEAKRLEYDELYKEFQKQKLMPFERAELARKEGNEFYKRGQIAARENNIPQALNHYQGAIERYSEGIDAGTSDHRLYSNRALCYAVLRDWSRAKKDAHMVVKLRQNFMKGWFTLVRAYIMESNLDEASKQLEMGLNNCDKHPDLVKLQEEIDAKRLENNNPLNSSARSGSKAGNMNQTMPAGKMDDRPRSYREYRENITPSRTPPTPLLQKAAAGVGGMKASPLKASPPSGVSGGVGVMGMSMGRGNQTMGAGGRWSQEHLEGTGQFGQTGGGQTYGAGHMYGGRGNNTPPPPPGQVDLDGTANFGRSIGYSRTPPRNASPGMGGMSARGFGTPPRDPSVGAIPHRSRTSYGGGGPPMGGPPMGGAGGVPGPGGYGGGYGASYGSYGGENPLNQSYTNFNQTMPNNSQYNVAAAARARSRTPTKDGNNNHTPPKNPLEPGPVRAPSLGQQAGKIKGGTPRQI